MMVTPEKVKRKLRRKLVEKLYGRKSYLKIYRAYWHAKRYKTNMNELQSVYFAARPNPGAGIGHQMANWIAGYWFAKKFGLKFAHIPFSSVEWEKFLGFYQQEVTVEELKRKGYKIRRIPLFDEYNEEHISEIEKIIHSYVGTKVVLLAEQDQFYHDQYGVMEEMQDKFYAAPSRKEDHLIYKKDNFNIAIHIRRGDIVQKPEENNENLTMRYQSNDYFINALETALEYLHDKKNIHIYLFSQGRPEDYPEFGKYSNIHFCLEMGARDSFLHMVKADALITSKSSFSYKPALLNKGIKFCPQDFWHGYPDQKDWILLDHLGKVVKERRINN